MIRRFDIVFVEGSLEEHMMKRLLRDRGHPVQEGLINNKGGQGNFWRSIAGINRSHGLRVAALADLEKAVCPGKLIRQKLGREPASFLTLNLAVRMLEAWLLADPNLAKYLKIPPDKLPLRPEAESHAKRCLLSLVRDYGDAKRKLTFLGPHSSTLHPGPDYEPLMGKFITDHWSPTEAARRSPSLKRALTRLDEAIHG